MNSSRKLFGILILAVITVSWGLVIPCAAQEKGTETPETMDLEEISRQLENPLTSLWSLTFEDSVLLQKGDAIAGTEPICKKVTLIKFN